MWWGGPRQLLYFDLHPVIWHPSRCTAYCALQPSSLLLFNRTSFALLLGQAVVFPGTEDTNCYPLCFLCGRERRDMIDLPYPTEKPELMLTQDAPLERRRLSFRAGAQGSIQSLLLVLSLLFFFRSVMSNSFVTSLIITHQASLSMGYSRKWYWSEVSCPSPGELPHPGIKPTSPASPALQANSSLLSHWGSPKLVREVLFLRWGIWVLKRLIG